MNFALLTAGFSLGLAGSLHCVGMCGPVVLAMPRMSNSLISAVTYHAGRAILYAAMGFITGWAGHSLIPLNWFPFFTIVMGLVLLVPFFNTSLGIKPIGNNWAFSPIGLFKKLYPKLLKDKTYFKIAVLGMLNGLYVCGLVYMAIGSSLMAGTAIGAAAFMLAFAAGNGIILTAYTAGIQRFITTIKLSPSVISNTLRVIAACLLLYRGISASVNLNATTDKIQANTEVICHN